MKTNFGSVTDAVRALQDGGVVLVPTETVVGLVCTEEGLSKVYEIKARDASKPVALLCRSTEEALSLTNNVSPAARKLAASFWPGSLTLIVRSNENGLNIGLRVPLGTVRSLLESYGGPLYATSANISGGEAPRALGGVEREILEAVDVIVAGEPGSGEASAVVDVSRNEPRIIRASGRLDEERLRELLAQ